MTNGPQNADAAWNQFFERTRTLAEIQRAGYAYVSAKRLKDIAQWEPRLLAKQDTLDQRPRVFRQNRLAIFPVRNGEYVLFADPDERSYFRFPSDALETQPQVYTSRVRLADYATYPRTGISSETQALDFAHISSLLRTFTQEEKLELVIRGRAYSGAFDFELPGSSHVVEVQSVQIEVDSGYETPGGIYLVEAKLGRHDDFHIRQLYYPYLEWSHRSNKRVVPIFLVYTNARYYFYEFAFSEHFGEIRLVRSRCYVVNDKPAADLNLDEMLQHIPQGGEPRVPFPQANDMDKVIDVLALLRDGVTTKEEISLALEFDERQGDYYGNAARYLGFADKKGRDFILSSLGQQLLEAGSIAARTTLIVEALLKRPTFRRAIRLLVDAGLDTNLVRESDLERAIEAQTVLTGTTPARRVSTVKKWLRWILQNGKFA